MVQRFGPLIVGAILLAGFAIVSFFVAQDDVDSDDLHDDQPTVALSPEAVDQVIRESIEDAQQRAASPAETAVLESAATLTDWLWVDTALVEGVAADRYRALATTPEQLQVLVGDPFGIEVDDRTEAEVNVWIDESETALIINARVAYADQIRTYRLQLTG